MGSSFSEVCLANSIDLPARLSPIVITRGLVEYNLYKRVGGGGGEKEEVVFSQRVISMPIKSL